MVSRTIGSPVEKAQACVELSLAILSLLSAEDNVYKAGFRVGREFDFERMGRHLKTISGLRHDLSDISRSLNCPKTRGML